MNYALRKCSRSTFARWKFSFSNGRGLDCFSLVLSNTIHMYTLPWFNLFFQTHQNNSTKLFHRKEISLEMLFSVFFPFIFSRWGKKGTLLEYSLCEEGLFKFIYFLIDWQHIFSAIENTLSHIKHLLNNLNARRRRFTIFNFIKSLSWATHFFLLLWRKHNILRSIAFHATDAFRREEMSWDLFMYCGLHVAQFEAIGCMYKHVNRI